MTLPQEARSESPKTWARDVSLEPLVYDDSFLLRNSEDGDERRVPPSSFSPSTKKTSKGVSGRTGFSFPGTKTRVPALGNEVFSTVREPKVQGWVPTQLTQGVSRSPRAPSERPRSPSTRISGTQDGQGPPGTDTETHGEVGDARLPPRPGRDWGRTRQGSRPRPHGTRPRRPVRVKSGSVEGGTCSKRRPSAHGITPGSRRSDRPSSVRGRREDGGFERLRPPVLKSDGKVRAETRSFPKGSTEKMVRKGNYGGPKGVDGQRRGSRVINPLKLINKSEDRYITCNRSRDPYSVPISFPLSSTSVLGEVKGSSFSRRRGVRRSLTDQKLVQDRLARDSRHDLNSHFYPSLDPTEVLEVLLRLRTTKDEWTRWERGPEQSTTKSGKRLGKYSNPVTDPGSSVTGPEKSRE